mmetsp:Transcript_149168/g.212007  ORF Transcript_149168/g.212007 Transcript_149168/m.212007 type:complete len:217 (-) Transcript_149168:1264-1914(-)
MLDLGSMTKRSLVALHRGQSLKSAARAARRVLPRRRWDILTPTRASSRCCWSRWGRNCGRTCRLNWDSTSLRAPTALRCRLLRRPWHVLAPAGTLCHGARGARGARAEVTVGPVDRGSTGAAQAIRSGVPGHVGHPSAPVYAGAVLVLGLRLHHGAFGLHGRDSAGAEAAVGGVLPGSLRDPLAPSGTASVAPALWQKGSIQFLPKAALTAKRVVP